MAKIRSEFGIVEVLREQNPKVIERERSGLQALDPSRYFIVTFALFSNGEVRLYPCSGSIFTDFDDVFL